MWVQSLGQEDPLEKGMATHSSILAWRIPRTEEPGRLQSMGSKELDKTEHAGRQAVFQFVCVCVCMCVCICVCVCVCVCVYVYICIYRCVSLYIHTLVYMCVYIIHTHNFVYNVNS